MKKITKYMALGALLLSGAAITGCQDSFGDPKVEVPVATLEPNMTIAEFKALMWQDAENYCVEIPAREDGSHYIISGRVISSDYDGNIFKSLVIQDETAALAMSINQYNLYMTHRIGQELVLDLTGMYVGKYAGYFQLGFPGWYEAGATYQTSFMAPEIFNAHCELNGLPEPDKTQAIVLENLPGSSVAELQQYQGQLVRFNNVTFKNAGQPGQQLCDTYHSSGFNQALLVNGSELTVRTSGYAKFWNMPLPDQAFDIEGILGYFNGWQFLLISADGIMNVGDPTAAGTQSKPYEVEEAIALASTSNTTVAWVKGIIVGTVAPEVTTITNMADITTAEPFIMNNSLVIAPAATGFTLDQIMVINLPEGTPLAEYGNLVDNPDNFGKEINIQGRFTQELGVAAVANSTGAVGTFTIEGVELPDAPSTPGVSGSGDGSETSPYTCSQVIAMALKEKDAGPEAWVEGYIVGSAVDKTADSFTATAEGASGTNIFIAESPAETDYSKCIPVQLPTGDVRTALNLAANPANFGKKVSLKGMLCAYFGMPGVKFVSEYKWDGASDTPDTPSEPAEVTGAGTEASPYTCADVIALGNPGTKAWAEGYIVGTMSGSSAKWGLTDAVNSNLLIAPTADCTDLNLCVPVELPIGNARTELNLVDHPGYLGKKLKIEGTLTKYFSRPGIKAPAAWSI